MSCRKNAYGIIGKKGHYSFGTMKVMAVIQFEFSCFYFLCNFKRLLSMNHEVSISLNQSKFSLLLLFWLDESMINLIDVDHHQVLKFLFVWLTLFYHVHVYLGIHLGNII